jgi:peptide/nickel transport system permease protein
MTDLAVELPPREGRVLRTLKAVALLRESPVGLIGAAIVLFWVIVAIFAQVDVFGWFQFGLAPFSPNATLVPLVMPGTEFILGAGQSFDNKKVEDVCRLMADGQYDCGTFWLGTDHIGRDILSRIIHGSRQVLFYGPIATVCAYAVGMIAKFGASGINIVLAVTFASAPGIMRIVRGLVLDLRNREYVFAAETRGERSWRIMVVEILPNARGPLIVDACLRLGYVIITIGVLGFLGLGLPPPDPDWGGMINETRVMAMSFPHMALFPCLAISSLVLGFNLVADGLREVALRD